LLLDSLPQRVTKGTNVLAKGGIFFATGIKFWHQSILMYRKDIVAANRMPGWSGAALSLYRSHFIT
jgi:hypothetical protein